MLGNGNPAFVIGVTVVEIFAMEMRLHDDGFSFCLSINYNLCSTQDVPAVLH